MALDSDLNSQLTIGERDPRITGIGYYLRKFKIDELPQLINVLAGQMSMVGPRPEVRKYVDLYTDEQKIVLSVKPGITDFASIMFVCENETLASSDFPENTYIYEILPTKIKLNMKFINNSSISNYFYILYLTIRYILKIK